MNKAIISKWECPSCGCILESKEVFQSNAGGTKYSFSGPKQCGCGRKGKFNLLSFESATAIIEKDTDIKQEIKP